MSVSEYELLAQPFSSVFHSLTQTTDTTLMITLIHALYIFSTSPDAEYQKATVYKKRQNVMLWLRKRSHLISFILSRQVRQRDQKKMINNMSHKSKTQSNNKPETVFFVTIQ